MPSITPVPAPPAAPPVIGLLASLTPFNDPNVRWQNPDAVISYLPEGCNQDGAPTDLCEVLADVNDLTYSSLPGFVEWRPYSLNVTEVCSTYGSELRENEVARVKRLMLADTERQLGAELWDGALAQAADLPGGDPYPNTWLANVADVDILTESGAVTLSHGMACLDSYLAHNNSGQQGAIHATVQALNHWVTLRIAEFINGKWYSPGGNLIIASPGYSGTDPNGNVGTDNVWAYATDMPRIFLDKPTVAPIMSSIDRVNNTMYAKGQRLALAEWQRCRHGGVRLALTVCDEGGS